MSRTVITSAALFSEDPVNETPTYRTIIKQSHPNVGIKEVVRAQEKIFTYH